MKKGLTIFLITIGVLVLIVLAGVLHFNNQFKAFLKDLDQEYAKIEKVDLTQLPDGEYHGRYGKIPVMFDLEVIVRNHQIDKIIVVEKSSGPDHDAPETMDRIIKAQQCKVDVVTGATTSSKAIMVAAYKALTSI